MQNLVYQWDGVGNLSWRRDDNQNLTEAFGYDHLHRLTASTLNGVSNLSVAYNALGNITSKTGVGTYTYHATKKHAVVSTSSGGSYAYDANGNMTSRNGSTISWASFNLPTVIHGSGSNSSQFFYTPDRARYKQVANYAGTTETTIYVGGLLEKLTRGALTEFRHLIQAGQEHTVIYTRRSNGTTDTFHVTRDHLGSAAAITDASGNVLVQESFTAFGARRGANWAGSPSSADWTQIANTTRRGFTDHEHLDNLNLLHMNGRVYDPGLGRFISADPFIDGWTSTQGYNRYSYVHNNPLSYRDPCGFSRLKAYVRSESEGAGQIVTLPDGQKILLIPGAPNDPHRARVDPNSMTGSEYTATGTRPPPGIPVYSISGGNITVVSGDTGSGSGWVAGGEGAGQESEAETGPGEGSSQRNGSDNARFRNCFEDCRSSKEWLAQGAAGAIGGAFGGSLGGTVIPGFGNASGAVIGGIAGLVTGIVSGTMSSSSLSSGSRFVGGMAGGAMAGGQATLMQGGSNAARTMAGYMLAGAFGSMAPPTAMGAAGAAGTASALTMSSGGGIAAVAGFTFVTYGLVNQALNKYCAAVCG